MYLWDLEMEQLPLGWEEEYHQALQAYPNGKIIPRKFSGNRYYNDVPSPYFRDPVTYHRWLINLFHRYRNQALRLLSNGQPPKNNWSAMQKLLAIDIRLFNLLMFWVSPPREFDPGEFDPHQIIKHIDSTNFYYDFEPDELPTDPRLSYLIPLISQRLIAKREPM